MGASGYVPPGWPSQIRPPGADGWQGDATAFLLDCCPSDFRGYPVLRRHPVVLARFAVRFLDAEVTATTDGVAEVRTKLAGQVPPEVIQAAVEVWGAENARLVRVRREVELVERALRGSVFVPKL